ncbi:MAG TPA: hypothetical protein VMZ91_06595 [Candidatus Paceibacterota bacterium]|nr:hypothetical protein [Candidatus Paceibacterota bacterium]
MRELETLKDIIGNRVRNNEEAISLLNNNIVYKHQDLKQEAIKWLKEMEGRASYHEAEEAIKSFPKNSLLDVRDWIKHFF